MLSALGAYLLWGFLPILFRMLESAGSVLIVAERTLWSLVLLAIILAFTGGFAPVWAVLRDWRRLRIIIVSTVLLVANWLLYVWAVESGQVLEASFGYFINPLVNVAIGMVFLASAEPAADVAIAIACVAIAIQAWVWAACPISR